MAGARARWRWTAVALVLAAAQGVLLARTAWDKSDTIDEPHYLESAVSQWTRRDFRNYCDSPALPRWGFGLALRLVDPPLFDLASKAGRHPLWSRVHDPMRRNLFAARLATIAVTVAGGLFLWWAAASAFGPAAAAVSHALWSFSPVVLANGSLATLDAWAASFMALALWAGVRLVRRPGVGAAAVAAIALALAAACKVTCLGGVPVLAAAAAYAFRRDEVGGRVAAVSALAAATAFLAAVWAVYGFSTGPVDLADLCGRPRPLPEVRFGPVPAPAWLEGAIVQWLHGRKGHLGYLFGEIRGDGWWWFYLAALALKTTLGAQALVALRVASQVRARPPRRELLVDAALLAFPVLLLVAMSLGSAQNGIRYLLPAYPLAMAWAGRVAVDAPRVFGRRGLVAVGACLAAAAAESLRLHPHHLMFFNAWAGGPEGGPRYLIVGDDWGQDQRRLGAWQEERHPWRLFYTFYNGDPPHWKITHERPPCEPRPGFYALHAVEVHRPKRLPRGCLDWLTVEPPDARLGYSIYLYQVNRPRIARLVEARARVVPFWQSGGAGAGPMDVETGPETP